VSSSPVRSSSSSTLMGAILLPAKFALAVGTAAPVFVRLRFAGGSPEGAAGGDDGRAGRRWDCASRWFAGKGRRREGMAGGGEEGTISWKRPATTAR
jgi:hypothetical protein